MLINLKNLTICITQYLVAFRQEVENQYFVNYTGLSVIKTHKIPSNNLIPSRLASASAQSHFDYYDMFNNDAKSLATENVAVTTPGQSDCTACVFKVVWLRLN